MKDFESIGKMIEHFVIERNKQVDGAILGEIIEIAKENEMYKTIYLNEKEIIKALREYMEKQNPKTNYDRIKSMSVEEMSEIFDYLAESCGDISGTCNGCIMYVKKGMSDNCHKLTCTEVIKKWLLQEVSDE